MKRTFITFGPVCLPNQWQSLLCSQVPCPTVHQSHCVLLSCLACDRHVLVMQPRLSSWLAGRVRSRQDWRRRALFERAQLKSGLFASESDANMHHQLSLRVQSTQIVQICRIYLQTSRMGCHIDHPTVPTGRMTPNRHRVRRIGTSRWQVHRARASSASTQTLRWVQSESGKGVSVEGAEGETAFPTGSRKKASGSCRQGGNSCLKEIRIAQHVRPIFQACKFYEAQLASKLKKGAQLAEADS